MKISPFTSGRKGFTLIELLIAIAILGVLGGIAYPVYISISKNAARTAAEKVCTDIVNGVDNFTRDHNGMLPCDPDMARPDDNDQIRLATVAGQDARLIEILTNREIDDDTRQNHNRSTYLRSDEKQDTKNSDGLYVTDQGVSLYDPWGNPYYIVLCMEEEGCIDPYTFKRLRGKTCLAYSLGPDKEGAAPERRTSKSGKRDKRGKKDKKAEKAQAAAAQADLAETIEDNVYSWKKAQ